MLKQFLSPMSRTLLSAHEIAPIAAGRPSPWTERACRTGRNAPLPADIPGDAAALEARRRALLAQLAACLPNDPDRCAEAIHALLNAATWTDISAGDPYACDPCGADDALADTACTLAAALNLLRSELTAISPALPRRIESEIRRRVLAPLSADDAIDGLSLFACCRLLCAVILGGISESLRWPLIRRLCYAVDSHIARLPADGSIPGGLTHAAETAIALMDVAEIVRIATGGRIDPTGDERVACMADYILFSHINSGRFINPGVHSMQPQLDAESLFRFGQRVGDGALCDTAAWLLHNCDTRTAPGALTRALNRNTALALAERLPHLRLFRDGFLPSAGLMFMHGFSLHIAMTGGTDTSHADAGNICLMYKDQPVLIDLGGDACATDMHSLPTVDGFGQLAHTPARATECSGSNENASCCSVNLTGAYPEEAPISDYQRTLLMGSQKNPGIRLMEMLQLTREAPADFHFMCAQRPEAFEDHAVIGPVLIEWSTPMACEITPVQNAFRLTLHSPAAALHNPIFTISAR